MKTLLNKITEVSKKYEDIQKKSGNNFNVFNVINVTSDEVRLHSRFLAELLDPNGSHGQEDLFLRLFIDMLGLQMNTKAAIVSVELYIGEKTETHGGFIDIYIDDKRGQTITIENKIYAPDQNSQLLRYHNYNKKNLYYLTLYGEGPSKKSIQDTQGTKLELDKDYKCISYRDHIKEWLISSRKEAVQLPLLREGISHYLNLVDNLTGKTNNDIMNKEIVNYITASENSLKQACLIEENMTNIKIEVQWKFWVALKLSFEDKFNSTLLQNENLKLVPELGVTKENVKSYYGKRNRDKYFGLWVKIYDKNNRTIHFGIDLEDEIYYGFTIEKNGKGGIALEEENSLFRNMALDIHHNYQSSEHWMAYRYTEIKLNFRAFNSKDIFELADDNKLNEKVNQISDTMIKDIIKFKQKLETL